MKKGPTPRTLAERFWPHVTKSDGCWLWMGATDYKGYGRLSRGVIDDQESVLAHRCAWQLAGRHSTHGMTLDHLCRNRACVRVDHLEEVTPQVNTLRGEAPTILAARAGRCLRGHSVSGENAVNGPDGRVRCVACRRASLGAYYDRHKNRRSCDG